MNNHARMTTANEFYEDLARTPELPPHLYAGIRRDIRRHAMLVRTVLSLAATLVLTVGVTLMLASHNRGSGVISSEVAGELQSVADYGSGRDISNDLESYSLYEGDMIN